MSLSEQHMPERLIVVATSNDASGLDEALLQRFEVFPFSAGPTFAEACQERLAWIWEQEAGPGVPMPLGWSKLAGATAATRCGGPWRPWVPRWKCAAERECRHERARQTAGG